MDFTKGATDEELFYDIPELDMRKFDDFDSFSTSPAINLFGTNYVYAYMSQYISSVSVINSIVLDGCTVAALVHYCINGFSGCNLPMDVSKIRNLLLFKPENIVMKTIEATTQIIGFN